SRSAWIGAAVAVLIVLGLTVKSAKLKKALYVGVAIIVVVGIVAGFGLRHNLHFQNEILHTQANSQVKSTSNSGHLKALKTGLHDIFRQPFGRGTGTAGPASVYNKPHAARLAENYFIQIGQETGWLGLAIFVMINLLTAKLLWRCRREPLAISLLAALAGIILVNLLSHAWTDPTLAYIWWGLAGVALAPQFVRKLSNSLTSKSRSKN
ncbi:MAG: O-antigen ligase family protein, partial [Candidatus Saccharimonadales bacterium]